MARLYLYADETGNFDLASSQGATRYFGVGTMLLDDADAEMLRQALHRLRMSLAWQTFGLDSNFHASEDSWPLRSAVMSTLALHAGRVDVTLIDKRAAPAGGDGVDVRLYAAAWRRHLSRLLPVVCRPGDELMVVAARIGTKRRRALFRRSVENALDTCDADLAWSGVAFWPSSSDPCLWAADYCVWAVGRRWEIGDKGPYGMIAHRVATVCPELYEDGDTPPD